MRRLENAVFCGRGGRGSTGPVSEGRRQPNYVPRWGAGAISVSERHPRYVASVCCRKGGAPKSALGRAHRRIGEVSRRPEECRPARRPRPPADKTDKLVATPAAFDAGAAARARRGPRASALLKDHRGAAKAPAFRRRRAPTGWAALPIDAVGARRRPHHRERASERARRRRCPRRRRRRQRRRAASWMETPSKHS